MDLKQIQELIRFVAKSGVSEVEIEQKDFKIVIKTQGEQVYVSAPQQQQSFQQAPVQQIAPAPAAAPPAPAPAAPAPKDESKLVAVKSPMIGTYYSRPSPDKDVFVKVGDKITKGQVVCVIEAMKLFNEIESEVNGTIVQILVDDKTPVEYDMPLFMVEPA